MLVLINIVYSFSSNRRLPIHSRLGNGNTNQGQRYASSILNIPVERKDLLEPASQILLDAIKIKNVSVPSWISEKLAVPTTYAKFPIFENDNSEGGRKIPISGNQPMSKNILSNMFSFLGNNNSPSKATSKAPVKTPIVLLHGFDSSALEYRRLAPLIATTGRDVYIPDMLGWGFNDQKDVKTFDPEAKLEHLKCFIRLESSCN